jgi:hypothetical protein
MYVVVARTQLLFAAALAAMPVVAGVSVGGCGATQRTACLQFSQQEYAASGNSCPSADDALQGFTDPSCPGPVVSVNGAGSFDGEICCYAVTYDDGITPDCGNSSGGSGTTTTVTDGIEEDGVGFASAEEATGVTSGGASVSCLPQTCSQVVAEGLGECGVTAAGASALSDLSTCASNQCFADCPNFPSNSVAAVPACQMCLQGSCSGELEECDDN